MTYTYTPRGVCSRKMTVELENGVIKSVNVSRLGPQAQAMFTREAGWTDLYTLAYPDLSQGICGKNWTPQDCRDSLPPG